MSMSLLRQALIGYALVASFFATSSNAQSCRDAVVLVHGNSGSPGDFDTTYNALLANGYNTSQILRPNWGNKWCPACNDHNGSEETPVIDAMVEALARSCSGRIDVIGHSMGATLAAHQIRKYGLKDQVDTFIGIAGAFRGLRSCGVYPFNVPTSTCGYWGMSVSSPLLDSLWGHRFGSKVYSIKSWIDQVVCYGGLCTVGGVHASSIPGEDGSHTHAYGHFGLLDYTAAQQVTLIQ